MQVLQPPPSKISDLTTCPACAAPLRSAGMLVAPLEGEDDLMLQGALREGVKQLEYVRCEACQSLLATDARRNPEVLDAIYRGLPDAYWQHLNTQPRFAKHLEMRLAPLIPGGDLWDVGCGSGHLLLQLNERWQKHGIEPGEAAVRTATAAGLDVRQGSASELALRNVADCVLMIDVAEHLSRPDLEFAAAYHMLRPGGVLAVFTGAADSWTARVAGSRWYYLHCAGHVTVFSRAALAAAFQRAGLDNVSTETVEHNGAVGLGKWLKRGIGNVARRALGKRPAAMPYYHDHQLVVGRRPT